MITRRGRNISGGNYSGGNITVRKPARQRDSNMALTRNKISDQEDSLQFIDSILSSSEMEEVQRMLLSGEDSPTLITSTQMCTVNTITPAPGLSPISPPNTTKGRDVVCNNRFAGLEDQMDVINCINKTGSIYSKSEGMGKFENLSRYQPVNSYNEEHGRIQGSGGPVSKESWHVANNGKCAPKDAVGRALADTAGPDAQTDVADTVGKLPIQGSGAPTTQRETEGQQPGTSTATSPTGETLQRGDGKIRTGWEAEKGKQTGSVDSATGTANSAKVVTENAGKHADKVETSDTSEKDPISGDEEEGEGDNSASEEGGALRELSIAAKFEMVNQLLCRLDGKSDKLNNTVSELQVSLEYSQAEIDGLKKENHRLKQQLEELETEDSRAAYQMKKMEDKMDKLETTSKKKNLVLEGVPEQDGGKEDVEKTAWELLDQFNINKGMEIENCYRMGNYNIHKPRPVIIAFAKQQDRDLFFSKRMELRHTDKYKRVWVNEDLGQVSKKKRNIIRLITKQAQAEGIDCKSGKYAIYVDKQRFDNDNLDELPLPLRPSSVKQVQIDQKLIAYQSESAPFSNFYPIAVNVANKKFVCLEQAYQYIKAKTLNKFLAATRIFLSRDPAEMRRIGEDLGTSDLIRRYVRLPQMQI